MKDFIDIQINIENLDNYYIRSSIFKSLKEASSTFSGSLLDIGCGKMPYKNYILTNTNVNTYTGLDIDTAHIYDANIQPDFTWDGIKMPFDDESFECAFGTEVLEHCPEPEIILKEIYRVLKPGGVFFFTVPFLWNLHEIPNDEYRFTPFSLDRHFRKSGFSKIEIKATGGWHASMAQMLGLWVRRSPMKKNKRKLLSKCLKPVIEYLIKLDKPDKVQFKDGQMITGLYGLVRK
ncbi:class I SAM-dependent methyltransferase [Salegentibacter agarivorans]